MLQLFQHIEMFCFIDIKNVILKKVNLAHGGPQCIQIFDIENLTEDLLAARSKIALLRSSVSDTLMLLLCFFFPNM